MKPQTAAWHDARRKGVGGSDATKIMAGEWNALWKVKTGRAQDDDLSCVLPVQMGVCTEGLNRAWFVRETGFAVDTADCESLTHPEHAFMLGNLDGRVLPDSIFEAKHVGDRYKLDEIASRYFWQLQHYIAIAGSVGCYLSVFFGNSRWEYATVARDDRALGELIAAERKFWKHVETDLEPQDRPKETVKVDLEVMREVDLTGNNAWANFAGDWISHRTAAKKFSTAEKEIKGMVPDDARRVFGHGIEVKRAVNSSLRIGEL